MHSTSTSPCCTVALTLRSALRRVSPTWRGGSPRWWTRETSRIHTSTSGWGTQRLQRPGSMLLILCFLAFVSKKFFLVLLLPTISSLKYFSVLHGAVSALFAAVGDSDPTRLGAALLLVLVVLYCCCPKLCCCCCP